MFTVTLRICIQHQPNTNTCIELYLEAFNADKHLSTLTFKLLDIPMQVNSPCLVKLFWRHCINLANLSDATPPRSKTI